MDFGRQCWLLTPIFLHILGKGNRKYKDSKVEHVKYQYMWVRREDENGRIGMGQTT